MNWRGHEYLKVLQGAVLGLAKPGERTYICDYCDLLMFEKKRLFRSTRRRYVLRDGDLASITEQPVCPWLAREEL